MLARLRGLKSWLLPAIGAALLVYVLRAGPERTELSHALPGDLMLQTLDGQTLGVADLRGHVVVLNLWASWCPACVAELPVLQQLFERERQSGLLVLGATLDEEAAPVVTMARESGAGYPMVWASAAVLARLPRFPAVPATFLVDCQGVVRERIVGRVSEADLRAGIARLRSAGGAACGTRTGRDQELSAASTSEDLVQGPGWLLACRRVPPCRHPVPPALP
jgi:thiol-disulfide isomerase/thioredoxin